jgi:hypothetical protein
MWPAGVIERLQPLGIEAALAGQAARSLATEDKRGQVELALEQARYEVWRARRQYDAVDPDIRLVAAELEKRWNDRLVISPTTVRSCSLRFFSPIGARSLVRIKVLPVYRAIGRAGALARPVRIAAQAGAGPAAAAALGDGLAAFILIDFAVSHA